MVFLAALLAGLLIRLLVSLLFRYARVYNTSGTRLLAGYLIPNKQGDLVFYSGLIPLLRRRKGVVVNQSNIQIQKHNDDFNLAESPAGFVDTNATNVSNEYGSFVADLENGNNRDSRAVIGDTEIAYSKGSIRSKGELSPYGAAIGALLHTQNETIKRTPDVRVGIGDLYLPSALVYLLFYFPLIGIFSNLNGFLFPLAMVGCYLAILGILYIVKHAVTMSNGSFNWTSLFDDNVSMTFINISVIILSLVLCLLSYYGIVDTKFLPALVVILFAVTANSFVFPRFRHIDDPYYGWSGSWRKPSFKPNSNPPDDLQDIRFSWVDILAQKGIKGDDNTDNLTIQLPSSDFEGDNPRVRKLNPFFDPQLTDENDRENFTNRVLDGADVALKNAGETNLYEDKVLTQIVNSAFQICKRYNLADFEMFDLILMFCQKNIEYKIDNECDSINNIMEYYRFACETLFDRTGDCDCKAILGYKLFELLGIKPQFVMAKTNGSENYNHAALVLRNDPDALIQLPPQYKEYAPGKGVYCEATSDGFFHPGDLPGDLDTNSLYFIHHKKN